MNSYALNIGYGLIGTITFQMAGAKEVIHLAISGYRIRFDYIFYIMRILAYYTALKVENITDD